MRKLPPGEAEANRAAYLRSPAGRATQARYRRGEAAKATAARYRARHRKARKSLDEWFEERIARLPSGCWEWQGALLANGYGRFRNSGNRVMAHRWAYERYKAAIPPGLQLDHICRNRRCVNPLHLDAVTSAENARRSPLVMERMKTLVLRRWEKARA